MRELIAQILSRKINPRSFDEIVKAEKKAAVEAAQKAGEDVSQMDLDAVALTAEEKAKELPLRDEAGEEMIEVRGEGEEEPLTWDLGHDGMNLSDFVASPQVRRTHC